MFDEYAIENWGESDAVDEFFKSLKRPPKLNNCRVQSRRQPIVLRANNKRTKKFLGLQPMLFNSFPFLFVFLPITYLGVFLLLRADRRTQAVSFVVICSLFFC